MRIGGKRRRLIKDGLPHRGLHRLARLVVSELEILPHLGVRHPFETGRAKTRMDKERAKFKQRETVCGENIQRIPKQFVRPRAEMVERPSLFQDLREFRDTDKIRRILFERIQSHGNDRICGLNEDEFVAQMTALSSPACVDRSQEKRRRVPMEIEIQKSSVRLNILLTQKSQERTLAGSCLSE